MENAPTYLNSEIVLEKERGRNIFFHIEPAEPQEERNARKWHSIFWKAVIGGVHIAVASVIFLERSPSSGGLVLKP